MLFSRAYLMQAILPSVPRAPKPPGTMMPSAPSRAFGTLASVSSVVSIQLTLTWASRAAPACSMALMMLA